MADDTGSPTTTAQPPFDDVNADIILHTPDHVNFHVFRVILTLSSPFFQDLFSLPQRSEPSVRANVGGMRVDKGKLNGVSAPKTPTVDVPEDSLTLDTLLRLLYPNTRVSSFHDLLHARNVALAASKYDMSTASELVASGVQTQYVESHPLEVYFVACHMGWKDVAKAAARYCLDMEVMGKGEIVQSGLLDYPGAVVAYHKLEEYRLECRGMAMEKLQKLDPFKGWEPLRPSCKGDERRPSKCWEAWATEYMGNVSLMAALSPTKEACDNGLIPDACCPNCDVGMAPLIAKVQQQVTSEIEAVPSEVELGFGF